jgi:hypothetical protein
MNDEKTTPGRTVATAPPPPKELKLPKPGQYRLKMEMLGEFHTTLSAVQQFINEAWGIEADLLLQYPGNLTLDIVADLPTTVMKQRAKSVRQGCYSRDLPFLLRVACHDGLIPVGRWHIRAE